MAGGFVYRLFLRVFAKSAVKDAYAGVLNREPDAGGLAAYTARVRRAGQTTPMLESMVQSDEAWRLMLKSRAATLAVQLHAALRDDGSGAEEVAATEQHLAAGDVEGALHTIKAAYNGWHRLVKLHAGELADMVYKALLERRPDQLELASRMRALEQGGDLASLLFEVGSSEEHRAKLRTRFPSFNYEELVTATYRGLLGRDPDPDAMIAYRALLNETGDVAGFIAEVGRSDEHRKRVLLRRG